MASLWTLSLSFISLLFLKVVIPLYEYYSVVVLEYDDDWEKE